MSPRLSEKDFIQESYKKDPSSFWFWFVLFTTVVAALWGGYAWYAKTLQHEYRASPFLQVTNREMSVFLWQAPELMRINASAKTAYMPGFQYAEKVSLELPFADDYVIAPPEVIFRYHAWFRLISDEFALRPISPMEFRGFLNYAEEWQPRNWPDAPEDYASIVGELDKYSNLADVLPVIVCQSFQGWKNYFIEGEEINAFAPSYQEVEAFLDKYPHYARNYWRNIAGLDYLASLLKPVRDKKIVVPAGELSPFLRVALFNEKKLAASEHLAEENKIGQQPGA